MATLARVLQSCALAVALAVALGAPQALKAATDSEVSTYGAAVEVAAKEAQRRGVHRAAALVCWGSAAERRLVLALSAVGVAVSLLRGRDQTTAAAVDSLLREGSGRTAIIVDMACPAAPRLLLLASKLRLFDLANSWFLFENGRLDPYASEDSTVNRTLSWDPGVDDFPDVELVTAGRYGAQRREEALLPDEEVLLEVLPPSRRASDRPWISSQVSM
ncbi:Ionotropic receptor 75b, partial [Frankliniella occidentalis]